MGGRSVGQTAAIRLITGETLILDEYTAQRDDAVLGISTDKVGSNLCSITADRSIITRKSVYFASQKHVKLRVSWPSGPNRLQKLLHGIGYIFQRLKPLEGGSDHEVLLQIDGDMEIVELGVWETIQMDPRHSYARDETVSQHLVRFGPIWDRLLRGLIPCYVEFQGPGRVWYSSQGFANGFLGYWGTPSAWLRLVFDRALGVVKAILGFGS